MPPWHPGPRCFPASWACPQADPYGIIDDPLPLGAVADAQEPLPLGYDPLSPVREGHAPLAGLPHGQALRSPPSDRDPDQCPGQADLLPVDVPGLWVEVEVVGVIGTDDAPPPRNPRPLLLHPGPARRPDPPAG
jgi:hypothetical protein